MQNGDVLLNTSSGRQTSVLKLLDECKGRWPKGEEARQRARIIERFVYNRLDSRMFGFETNITIPLVVPAVTKNKLRNLGLTWSSRLTKNRNTSQVWPHDASLADESAAEVANAILEYQRQIQNRDTLLAYSGFVAAMHGMVGFYNPWDPDVGPQKERVAKMNPFGQALRDELGNVQYEERQGKGAAHVEMLSIFDFMTSGEKDANLGKWLLVRRWLDEDTAQGILRAAIETAVANGEDPPFDDHVSITPVQTHLQTGPTRDAVEAYEMWWRPGPLARMPDGLFACIISGKVTKVTTFPYAHGELPIAVWRVQDVEEDFYGATWMEDAVPQQMGLNHSLRALQHCAEVAMQRRLLLKSSLAEKWGDSPDGFIEVETNDDVQNGANLVDGGGIPKDMYELCDRYEQGIDDTAGVSGVASSGDTAAATKNARLVAYATQVDEQKNEHASRNLEQAEGIIDTQQLKLWQQFVDNQRLVRVMGEDGSVSAAYFSGAEIPTDILLFPAPGAERMRAGQAKDAEERMAAGQLDPRRGSEMAETGLSSTIDEGEQRSRLQGLVQQALLGQPVAADLTITSDIAIPELRKLLQQFAPQGAKATMPIRALLHEYEQQRTQDQQPGQQMPTRADARASNRPNSPQQGNTLPSAGVPG